MGRRITTEDFKERAVLKHGLYYDYSKVKCIGATEQVCIICPKHGEFWQQANVHYGGCDCPICAIEGRTHEKVRIMGIYKITNKSNTKCYIGQSIDLESRTKCYKNLQCKGQPKIYRALIKYGWDNFSIEYLFESKKEYKYPNILLDSLEIHFIKQFNSIENGYNIYKGGNSIGEPSEETRLKMSLSQTGRKHSEEEKNKISQANKGENNFMFGKYGSDNPTSVKILQYDLENKFIKEWYSMADASRNLNIAASSISLCCNNKSNSAGGFVFRFKNSDIEYEDYSVLYDRKITKLKEINTGKKASIETLIKLTECRLGEKNHFYGKHHSDETKKILKEFSSIKVLQFDLNNIFIKCWDSISMASEFYNMTPSNIVRCCKGQNGVSAGYRWCYWEENVDPQKSIQDTIEKYNKKERKPHKPLENKVIINQYTLTNDFIKQWESISSAMSELNLSNHIIDSCKGIRKESGGFKWRYHEDGIEPTDIIKKEIFKEKEIPEENKILQYDTDNNFVKEWDSINQAKRVLGIKANISNCCLGNRNSAGGFIWKYKLDRN